MESQVDICNAEGSPVGSLPTLEAHTWGYRRSIHVSYVRSTDPNWISVEQVSYAYCPILVSLNF